MDHVELAGIGEPEYVESKAIVRIGGLVSRTVLEAQFHCDPLRSIAIHCEKLHEVQVH